MGMLKKLRKMRQKARAKVRGLTVRELEELEGLKKSEEQKERMEYKRWEAKEKVKRKYARKREAVKAGKGGGALETGKKVFGWLQERGDHARQRIESGALSGGKERATGFDDFERFVFGQKKKKRGKK